MQGPEASKIQNLFSEISNTYDQANDTITFGMARSWRKKLVKWSDATKNSEILDIATGTGDLVFDFYNKIDPKIGNVMGTDFCEPMLEVARKKADKKNLRIKFEWADACQLDFADETFDIVSISYGIRNVQNPEKAIQEMYRVLKPAGRMMILETGSGRTGLLGPFVHFYSQKLMPILGGLISGKKDAYNYLSESSSQFPSGKKFIDFIKKSAPFETVETKKILGGASFIYKAIK